MTSSALSMPLRLICSVSLPAYLEDLGVGRPDEGKGGGGCPVPISCSISRRDATMTILLWRSFRLP